MSLMLRANRRSANWTVARAESDDRLLGFSMTGFRLPLVRNRSRALGALIVAAAALVACESNTPPPTPSPSPGGGETITGRERLGWDQRADSAGELATFAYAIYVDGARSEIAGVSCGTAVGPAGFACSGQLPAMSPGVHVLQLTALRQAQPGLESARSAALTVTVTAASAGDSAVGPWPSGEAGVTADGIALQVEHLADGLAHPSDAAFDPFGRLFVAERAGGIRIFEDGRLLEAAIAPLENLTADGGVLAMALDPDFATTRHVFTLSTHHSRRGPVFRLTRHRELGRVLGERAVVFETPAPAAPTGALRFGPDGKIYLALGPTAVNDPAAYVGKVLRLNPDGSSPRDSQRVLPVYADSFIAPAALAWRPDAGALWVADGTGGSDWITGIGAGAPPPRASWSLPPGETTSALTFYQGNTIPLFQGQLFVASAEARRLLRIRFDPGDPVVVVGTERLLDNRVGPIRVVLVGPDGAVYFCTDRDLGRLTMTEKF
jgi:aldose sugar dehydrogenase